MIIIFALIDIRSRHLIVTQLVKMVPAIYGNQRFITVLTAASHWSPP